MHLPSDILSKTSRKDLGLIKLVLWHRRMHQTPRFNQPIPELTRLMISISRMKIISKNIPTPPEVCFFRSEDWWLHPQIVYYGPGKKIRQEKFTWRSYPIADGVLSILISCFTQGLSKIAASHTPRPRACLSNYQRACHYHRTWPRTMKLLVVVLDCFMNQLNFGSRIMRFVQRGPPRCQFQEGQKKAINTRQEN